MPVTTLTIRINENNSDSHGLFYSYKGKKIRSHSKEVRLMVQEDIVKNIDEYLDTRELDSYTIKVDNRYDHS